MSFPFRLPRRRKHFALLRKQPIVFTDMYGFLRIAVFYVTWGKTCKYYIITNKKLNVHDGIYSRVKIFIIMID